MSGLQCPKCGSAKVIVNKAHQRRPQFRLPLSAKVSCWDCGHIWTSHAYEARQQAAVEHIPRRRPYRRKP